MHVWSEKVTATIFEYWGFGIHHLLPSGHVDIFVCRLRLSNHFRKSFLKIVFWIATGFVCFHSEFSRRNRMMGIFVGRKRREIQQRKWKYFFYDKVRNVSELGIVIYFFVLACTCILLCKGPTRVKTKLKKPELITIYCIYEWNISHVVDS